MAYRINSNKKGAVNNTWYTVLILFSIVVVIATDTNKSLKMSVAFASTKIRVPLGFEHLLEGLVREVLREQPQDVVKFCSDYFKKKLQLRKSEFK